MTNLTVRAARQDPSTLTKLRLPELQALAAELGLSGASKLRKGELVDAISEVQNTLDNRSPEVAEAPAQAPADSPQDSTDAAAVATAPAVARKRAPRRASTSVVDAGASAAPIIDAPRSEPETAAAIETGAAIVGSAPKPVDEHVNRAKNGTDLIPAQEAERSATAEAQPTDPLPRGAPTEPDRAKR